jgi:hypothetical protein
MSASCHGIVAAGWKLVNMEAVGAWRQVVQVRRNEYTTLGRVNGDCADTFAMTRGINGFHVDD